MNNDEYARFIGRKLALAQQTGLTRFPELADDLYKPHQSALIRWALRRGRAAIFADTGLGKTRMELAWAEAVAKHFGGSVLLLTPLAVAAQSCREAASIGFDLNLARSDSDMRAGLNVINYDRLHLIDPGRFSGVVLDESSIIKHYETKTLASLLELFGATPFKLCASATPAPNDWTELGTHAEFLGICSRTEMLSEFFVHDAAKTQDWRLKGHAREAFWRWVSSWGAMVRRPSDLGFCDDGYNLPPLNVYEHVVSSEMSAPDGMLFALEASTLSERRNARRASMDARVAAVAKRVNSREEQELIWCDLNVESVALTAAIDGAVQITGSDDADHKERAILDFAEGRIKRLVTKPSIAGWGVNLQCCAHQSFVGVTDSYEAYYQAVRRSWRFGQTRPVNVDIYISPFEGQVLANLRRKERDISTMANALSKQTAESVRESVFGSSRSTNPYHAREAVSAPSWLQSEVI